jgi:hypothetical protein
MKQLLILLIAFFLVGPETVFGKPVDQTPADQNAAGETVNKQDTATESVQASVNKIPADATPDLPQTAAIVFYTIIGTLILLTAFFMSTGNAGSLTHQAWKLSGLLGFVCLLAGTTLSATGASPKLEQSLILYGGLLFGITLPMLSTIQRQRAELEKGNDSAKNHKT